MALYTFQVKKLLQQLCHDQVGWNETAPGKIVKEWQKQPDVINLVGLGSYRNFGFFTFLMPQRKDMVNLALSE